MTLDECYAALGLRPPLEFEREVYDESLFRQELGRKQIGSSTHMLVEATLDWYGFRERGIERSGWIIVMHEERGEHEHFRKTLSGLRDILGDIDESWFLLWENSGRWEVPSFHNKKCMVYIDHHLIDPGNRVTGPHRMVRSAKKLKDGSYACFDRDRRLVTRLRDWQGLDKLTELASCPVHVEDDEGSKLVVGGRTYDP